MKVKAFMVAAALALFAAAPAVAHEGADPDWPHNYCGFSDGDFQGGYFDRYQDTVIVTPGAPWTPGPKWHAVYHVVAHFGPWGWWYTNTEFCRWGYW